MEWWFHCVLSAYLWWALSTGQQAVHHGHVLDPVPEVKEAPITTAKSQLEPSDFNMTAFKLHQEHKIRAWQQKVHQRGSATVKFSLVDGDLYQADCTCQKIVKIN